MKKIELLLPAGNFEKMKFALLYGADACYIGGRKYSLRAQASNFSIEDFTKACEFAHNLNKKIYATVNVIPRENEIDGIKDYLIDLEKANVDGIIVSSPVILYLAKTYTNLHVSISTQMSTLNTNAVNFFHEMGAERVVLGRELSIEEIEEIKNNTKAEIEVFIHGGMCSGYSGRCTLSNYLSNRDANRGGCAHSCRWDYKIYENNELMDIKEKFQIASKDMCALKYVKELYRLGIDSLKIEGRMKSVHYVATLAYSYRKLLDDLENNEYKGDEYYLKLLEASENRDYYTGFYNGVNDNKINLYSKNGLEANQSFLARVISYDKETNIAKIETRNYFVNEMVEVMSPGLDLYKVNILNIYKDNVEVEAARHALEILDIKIDKEVKENDIIRRPVL